MWGAVIVMFRSRDLWKVNSKDHAVAAPTSGVHAGDDLGTALHHYRGLNCRHEIVMGKHSQLGPIDPQITLPTGLTLPAGALLQQFREASDQCTVEPARITAWLPTLQQYPPGLLNVCENAAQLSETLVAEFLAEWMFAGEVAAEKATEIAHWLGDDTEHLSHSRPLMRDQLREHGIKVADLEEEPELQDAVLTVHHWFTHTFGGPAIKIIENHLGRAYIKSGPPMMAPTPAPGP